MIRGTPRLGASLTRFASGASLRSPPMRGPGSMSSGDKRRSSSSFTCPRSARARVAYLLGADDEVLAAAGMAGERKGKHRRRTWRRAPPAPCSRRSGSREPGADGTHGCGSERAGRLENRVPRPSVVQAAARGAANGEGHDRDAQAEQAQARGREPDEHLGLVLFRKFAIMNAPLSGLSEWGTRRRATTIGGLDGERSAHDEPVAWSSTRGRGRRAIAPSPVRSTISCQGTCGSRH